MGPGAIAAAPGVAPAYYPSPAPYGQQASSPYEQLVAMIDTAAKTYAPNYELGEGMPGLIHWVHQAPLGVSISAGDGGIDQATGERPARTTMIKPVAALP
jgi:hypothetical protein